MGKIKDLTLYRGVSSLMDVLHESNGRFGYGLYLTDCKHEAGLYAHTHAEERRNRHSLPVTYTIRLRRVKILDLLEEKDPELAAADMKGDDVLNSLAKSRGYDGVKHYVEYLLFAPTKARVIRETLHNRNQDNCKACKKAFEECPHKEV